MCPSAHTYGITVSWRERLKYTVARASLSSIYQSSWCPYTKCQSFTLGFPYSMFQFLSPYVTNQSPSPPGGILTKLLLSQCLVTRNSLLLEMIARTISLCKTGSLPQWSSLSILAHSQAALRKESAIRGPRYEDTSSLSQKALLEPGRDHLGGGGVKCSCMAIEPMAPLVRLPCTRGQKHCLRQMARTRRDRA